MKASVIKRDGSREEISFDKVMRRLESLCEPSVDVIELAKLVIERISDGINTSDIDLQAASICNGFNTTDPSYSKLATSLFVNNLHKSCPVTFSKAMEKLYTNKIPIINQELFDLSQQYDKVLDETIDTDRDFTLSYFGVKTLAKSYLLKISDAELVETPQYLFMRVALVLHKHDTKRVIDCYNDMSKKYYIHATPTLYNAGTLRQGLSSCFLLSITPETDSIEGIYDTLKEIAVISKYSGGIGLSITDVRGKGSKIHSTNGESDGIIPMMKVFNESARYVTQANKRSGAVAIYIEMFHPEIEEFLQLRRNDGNSELRARDLFYGLWISDLFMKRVENNEKWSLFCPNENSSLTATYGKEFEEIYIEAEKAGKAVKVVQAKELFEKILISQLQTSGPYLLSKDRCNEYSNQKNLGTIRCSNLCTEIVQYSDENETACCNLASIGLPTFVKKGKIDYEKLRQIAGKVTYNLNQVIDIAFYSNDKTKRSNKIHRPVALGVSGLADVFIKLKIAFDSKEAAIVNRNIFETIYYGALEESIRLAKEHGPYESYEGSDFSKGILQFDYYPDYMHMPEELLDRSKILEELSDESLKYLDYRFPDIKDKLKKLRSCPILDWKVLKENMKKYGCRNSLMTAVMPVVSTCAIIGYSQCIEPIERLIYRRKTSTGDFVIINENFIETMIKRKIWNAELESKIIENGGSIQQIEEIPKDIRNIFKCANDISSKVLINLAADRSKFIDHSQSMNLFVDNADLSKLASIHFYSWRKNLKTMMYYLKQSKSAKPLQFTVPQKKIRRKSSPKRDEDKKTIIKEIKEINPKMCMINDPSCSACSG